MKIRSSYIWASVIALGVIGWFISDNFISSSDETETEIAETDASASEGDKAPADENVIANLTISAMEVKNQDIDLQIRASGVTSTSFDMVITSRLKATVTNIKAQEGSWVKEGDVIIQLDQGTLAANLDAARADRQAALAAYEDAKIKFGASGTLAAQLTAAEAELEAIEKNFNSTKQLVERGLQTELTLTNQPQVLKPRTGRPAPKASVEAHTGRSNKPVSRGIKKPLLDGESWSGCSPQKGLPKFMKTPYSTLEPAC